MIESYESLGGHGDVQFVFEIYVVAVVDGLRLVLIGNGANKQGLNQNLELVEQVVENLRFNRNLQRSVDVENQFGFELLNEVINRTVCYAEIKQRIDPARRVLKSENNQNAHLNYKYDSVENVRVWLVVI